MTNPINASVTASTGTQKPPRLTSFGQRHGGAGQLTILLVGIFLVALAATITTSAIWPELKLLVRVILPGGSMLACLVLLFLYLRPLLVLGIIVLMAFPAGLLTGAILYFG